MFKKVMVALDGSELARRALPYVRDLAQGTDTEVCVLEVIDSLDNLVRQLAGDTSDLSAEERKPFEERAAVLQQLQRDEAMRDLEIARIDLDAAGVRSVSTLVAEGHPAEEIVAAAQRLGCDAIAMGARGHAGTQREAIGSVAESVVLNAVGAAVIVVGPRTTGARGPQVFGARTISAPVELAEADAGAD
jgi:nucleotide-binding universal stress UspA family protein